MLLTLGICNSRDGTAAGEYALRYFGRRHPDATVFRRSEQRLRETEKCKTYGMCECRSSTDCTDTRQ
jgi:hypothetical protein